jgi:hypothetical protein
MDKNRQQGHSKEPIRNKVALEKGTGLAQGWHSRGLCEGLGQMQSLSKFLLPAVVPENKCSSPHPLHIRRPEQ